MRSGVIAKKVGMTRIYTDEGVNVPVTVLRLENVQVVSQRTKEKNGYSAVQLGAGKAKVKNEITIKVPKVFEPKDKIMFLKGLSTSVIYIPISHPSMIAM